MKTSPRAKFAQHPLAQIAVSYCGGILTSYYLHPGLSLLLTSLVLLSGGTILLLIKKKLALSGITLLVAAFCAGAILHNLQTRRVPASHLRELLALDQSGLQTPAVITGVIGEPTVVARSRLSFILKVESFRRDDREYPASGLVGLTAESRDLVDEQRYRDLQLDYGAHVRVATTLSWVDKYRNPGVSNLTDYLERNDYEATGFIKTPQSIFVMQRGPALNPREWLNKVRTRLQDQIDKVFSAETAGVLDAALLGNRFNLSRSTAERFRVGGTFHVLVISGLHISFLGGLVLLGVKLITKNRAWQFCCSNLVVWFYSIAVGAEPSVTRAALMFSFVSFAAVLYRSASSFNALGGAGLLLLVIRPTDLFNPSLQLTFLSVSAIVVFAWPVLKNLQAIGRWRPTRSTPYPPSCSAVLRDFSELLFWNEREWSIELSRSAHRYRLFKNSGAIWLEHVRLQNCASYIFSAVLVSFCVQVVLLPFLVIYFHRISFAAFALNIIVSLLLVALIAVTVCALMVSVVSVSAAVPLATCANALNWLMIHSVDLFSHAGIASVRIPEYSGSGRLIYVLYFVPMWGIAAALSRWSPLRFPGDRPFAKRLIPMSLMAQSVLVALVVLHPLSARRADGKLHVEFLDVGQGDSALVTMPNGLTLLVDGGGRPNFFHSSNDTGNSNTGFEADRGASIGEAVVSEYLWSQGLDSLDYVLATHADADHIDGLNDVVNNFAVRGALVGRTPMNDPEYARFAQNIADTSTPVFVIESGDKISIGGVSIEVLWPNASRELNAPSRNNDSVVLRIAFGSRAILMTGDIEKEAERELVSSAGDLRADVIKVPHHGSRTSSIDAFVRACHSSVAIISVGRTSMFGHPHREVVERWFRAGARVMTTGNSGTISVTTDGSDLDVHEYVHDVK